MKLPMIMIAKGKTKACRKQLGKHRGKKFNVLHSETGWSNNELMLQYLKILRQFYDRKFATMSNYKKKKTQIHLIWDCYKAHLNETVRALAGKLNIMLHYVPAGGTSKLQPLDIKVFGALKAKARNAWANGYLVTPNFPQTKESSVQILLECWDNLDNASIESAWKVFQHEQKTAADDEDISTALNNDQLLHLGKQIANTHLPEICQKCNLVPRDFIITVEIPDDELEEEEDQNGTNLDKDEDNGIKQYEYYEDEDYSTDNEPPPNDFIIPIMEPDSPEDEVYKTAKNRLMIQSIITNGILLTTTKPVEEIIKNSLVFTPNTPQSAVNLLEVEFVRMRNRTQQAKKFKKSPSQFPEVVGIVNFGTNCYFNSALQILYQMPNLKDLIAQFKSYKDGSYTEEKTFPSTSSFNSRVKY
jgi:hypothetical protein